MKIRKILKSDHDFFIAASTTFYSSEAVSHGIPADYHESAFDELMRSDRYQEGFILEADGVAAGYALISKTYSREAGGTVWWLEELFLYPEYRSMGFGHLYFDFIEKKAVKAGVKRLRLEVSDANTRAAALYSKLGYTPLGYSQMIKEF